VVTPNVAEHVACGAALQAASVLHGEEVAALHATWALDEGTATEPSVDAATAAEVRTRYRTVATGTVTTW
jgi:hypothetical protein